MNLTRTNALVAVAGLALSFGIVQTVIAQSGVAGRVVDTVGQPLPGVSVMMLPASGGQQMRTTTGADGTYRFDKVPDGDYRVDFELIRFDVIRRNFVYVRNGRSTFADATLRIRPICECVVVTGLPPVVTKSGRVLDAEGRPLPRARLEMVAPLPLERGLPVGSPNTWSEVTYADAEGRFTFYAPVDTTWKLTVSDSGFRPVTQQVSGSVPDPLVIRLTFTAPSPINLPEYERLNQGCGCEGNLFGGRQ